ncbi:MAG: RloB family protein [Elusimicrobiota bacterium]|nr:RloB family protein [Elusimicrobiota bacterium]
MNSGYGYKRMPRSLGAKKTKSILIICEGVKTEPNYFYKFKEKIEDANDINIKIYGKGANTLSLVDMAIEMRDEKPNEYIEVWCVFDKDSFKADNFDNAIHKAESKKIRAAWSNECFELWYMLHFDYHTAALNRKQYTKVLNKSFQKNKINKKYKKNDKDMYNILENRQHIAIRNAEKLILQFRANTYHLQNPSTTVYSLVKRLNEFIPNNRA